MATLASYGVETAADINQSAILAVPGFGPTLTIRLTAWRKGTEQRFVFDPRRGVDPAAIATVDREIRATQARLEQTLRGGADQLAEIARQTSQRRATLLVEVGQVLADLAQAEADWNHVLDHVAGDVSHWRS